jgi:sugar phosphate isomerase/epimerase
MNPFVCFGLKRVHAVAASVLLVAIAIGCATETGPGIGKSFKGPIGLQLYSLRAQFTRNVPEAVKTVQGFGIKEVELAGLYNLKPDVLNQMLTSAGLQPISEHIAFERLRDDPEGAAKEAQIFGLKYVGTAWIPHNGAFDADQARAAAKVFNNAGRVFAKYGMKCFYHCHGYEFQPGAAGPGTTAMDILMVETDPKLVCFQMDICWVVFPGEDPVKWLQKYGGRWELMHVKDLKKGVATGFHNGGTDPNNDVTLGTGQMNWPDILRAARQAGVKHYFIEDESATSVAQIPESLKYLAQVSW